MPSSLSVPGSVACVITSSIQSSWSIEGDIVDVLAAVEDFLLAQATYEAAKQRWPKERIRLSQQTRIVEDSNGGAS
jgi:hypothetical protein